MAKENLKLYFYNTLTSNRIHELLFQNYNVKSGNAAQKFFYLLANGFAAKPKVSVFVTSILPINSQEQKKIFWKLEDETEYKIEYEYIPLINIVFVRNLLLSLMIFFKIIFQKFPRDSQNIIIVDFLRFSINLPLYVACKLRRIKILAIVTDLPGEDVLKRTIMGRIRNLFIFSLSFDYYICVTKLLNEAVNKKKKPNLIIEGFVDINLKTAENSMVKKSLNRVIVYAGALYEEYGLKNLIEAFLLIPDPDLRLSLYGVGPYVNSIIGYSKMDDRIQYKGIIANAELLTILNEATLLVNPRPIHEIFTKYSFPSKNMEYMSTGTPLLTTRLSGIPEDHQPYVFFINEDSVNGVYEGLLNVLKKGKSEIHSFGLKAQAFTIREKNNIKQAEKIINLLQNNP